MARKDKVEKPAVSSVVYNYHCQVHKVAKGDWCPYCWNESKGIKGKTKVKKKKKKRNQKV